MTTTDKPCTAPAPTEDPLGEAYSHLQEALDLLDQVTSLPPPNYVIGLLEASLMYLRGAGRPEDVFAISRLNLALEALDGMIPDLPTSEAPPPPSPACGECGPATPSPALQDHLEARQQLGEVLDSETPLQRHDCWHQVKCVNVAALKRIPWACPRGCPGYELDDARFPLARAEAEDQAETDEAPLAAPSKDRW